MKRLCLMLLCAIFFISGCSASHEESSDEVNVSDMDAMENWLSEDFSFLISFQYMNLAKNGISQETLQELAKDGSFHFVTSIRQWDHTADFEFSNHMEYYYRYEDDALVCYVRADDEDPERMVLTPAEEKALADSKSLIVDPEVLLPSYLENFHETDEGYSFSLPLDKVINSNTMLASYVQYAFALYGSKYDPTADINILCNIEVEKETLRPVKFSYDFNELKPYVLSEGALSGEYALDTDLMYMTFELDYELAQTIPVPDEFIP